jgi:hypothetical protein
LTTTTTKRSSIWAPIGRRHGLGVASERSFCLFNAVGELVLQMIARYFAFGHETPEQR